MRLLREYIRKHLIAEKIYKPVYRATNAPGVKTGRYGTSILYWADDPRPADFGKHITKAKIRLEDPYMGTSTETYNVVALMRDDEVIKILKDIDYVNCVKCDSSVIIRTKLRLSSFSFYYKCSSYKCNKEVSVFNNTFFSNSKISMPLQKIILLIW